MLKGVYRPQQPKATAFYQCGAKHVAEFEAVYAETYQVRFEFSRPVVEKVVKQFLDCGDLTRGVAQVTSGEGQHESRVASSCKGRDFCPSCHQTGVLQFAIRRTATVLAPVPHRQSIVTLPKIIQVYF